MTIPINNSVLGIFGDYNIYNVQLWKNDAFEAVDEILPLTAYWIFAPNAIESEFEAVDKPLNDYTLDAVEVEIDTTSDSTANLLGSLDSDEDGLLDSWELEFFNNLDLTPIEDFDGDGYTNFQEYERRTDPTRYVLKLRAGWNAIAIARMPDGNSVSAIFADHIERDVTT